MSTSFKKLLLILVTALLGVMNSGAMAITYYDFTFTGDNGSVVGIFGVNDSSIITSISGSVSGTSLYDGAITGLINAGSYGGNDNLIIHLALLS